MVREVVAGSGWERGGCKFSLQESLLVPAGEPAAPSGRGGQAVEKGEQARFLAELVGCQVVVWSGQMRRWSQRGVCGPWGAPGSPQPSCTCRKECRREGVGMPPWLGPCVLSPPGKARWLLEIRSQLAVRGEAP